jgi:WD40 repeat protein
VVVSTVDRLARSSDGTRLATASYNGTARIWTAEGIPMHDLTGHTRSVWSLACSARRHPPG